MATVIIGAGVGGLAAAIVLAAAGEPVKVLERQTGPGGKMLPVVINDMPVDSGPTVLTMLWVFEELFATAGLRLQDEVVLNRLSVLARHFWTGGTAFDLYANRQETADAIGRLAGTAECQGYLSFSAEAQKVHHALLDPFLKSHRPSPWGLSRALPVKELIRINPFETLWNALCRYFKDQRLRQLFGRYATYCGSSPFRAPATLMLVADVEANGVWQLTGGMSVLSAALHSAASRLGVSFEFGVKAKQIEIHNAGLKSVLDDHGNIHRCRQVIVNADASALAAGLLGSAAQHATTNFAGVERSLSAVTWCGEIEHDGPLLEHHNVFFSDDYVEEFKALQHGPAEDPTVYLCKQSSGRKLLLINAPATGTRPESDPIELVHRRLARAGHKLTFKDTNVLCRTPKEFSDLYPATNGALYGRATHGWLSTFQRPQARTRVPGLYLAGGSVHPGPGVPMAALSGIRAAEALLSDRALTRRSA